jgi:hypothetical protein
MKQNGFLINLLALSMFIACNISIDTKEIFEDFYSKYYSDSIFQFERTIFPLPGYNSIVDLEMPDDIAELLGVKIDDEYHWKKEEWIIINTVPDDDENIKKKIIKSDTLVIEELIIPNSGFNIIRKFKLIENNWYLVYYFYQI